MDQFDEWFSKAREDGIDLPDAACLATAGEDGYPSGRMVVLREYDASGLVFYTHYRSQKGQQLASNPRATMVFFWKEQDRQIRVSGDVSRVSREQSRAYFQQRPRSSQIAALASAQSQPLPHREALEDEYDRLRETYAGDEIPLPENWGGYHLAPEQFHFWQGRVNRLHDRFRYTRESGKDRWCIERLAP